MLVWEKSRVPLPVEAAFERMNLPRVAEQGHLDRLAMSEVAARGRLLQDHRPLWESLEWIVARAHWQRSGLLPFIESEVPFVINNSGRLSRDAALVFLEHCLESAPAAGDLCVLEIGAGTGLFARYFLDWFRAFCEEKGTDYYRRLRYVVTDASAQTAAQWQERGLFAAHADHVVMETFDPLQPGGGLPTPGRPRAVFCNYVLDVMPSTVVRMGVGGPEELRVRTFLTSDSAAIAGYTTRTPAEIAALAEGKRPQDLLELVPLLPLFEFEASYQAIPRDSVPYLKEAGEIVAGEKLLLNDGALHTLQLFIAEMADDGFVLVNDYGPTNREQQSAYCSSHRFGPTVAFGINFPLLELFCAQRTVAVTSGANDEKRGIHTRLLSRAALPRTRAVAAEAFSLAADTYHHEFLEQARAHANAGRQKEALDAYREALTRNPRNWQVLGEAGEFLATQLKSFDAAVELLRAAVELNPCYSSWLWNAIGDSLYCLERFDDAHEAYLQAARIDPDDPRTNLNLAYTLTHFGRLPEALTAIARGLSRDDGELYLARMLEKQRYILTLLSNRRRGEQDALARRATRLHNA